MSNLRQIALVLGMHRSGTSALAALVSRLGFNLGKNILPANEFNAKGYYENDRVVRFHTEALEYFGSSWHDLRILPENGFRTRWIDDAALKLASILQAEFGNAGRIVVKDPRACRLLPIWQRFSRESGIDLRVILIGRHPLEVCYSLSRRDGFSRLKSLLLWLQHNLQAEKQTRSQRRLILRYEDLLSDPKAKAAELAAFLKVPRRAAQIEEAARSIESSLAHHHAESELLCGHPDVSRWTKTVWKTLFQKKPLKAPAQHRLDAIFKQLSESLSILPEEAVGFGDYKAAAVSRALSKTDQEYRDLKERYKEQNQNLRNVMARRDELRKQAESAAAARERLARENSALTSMENLRADLLRTEQEKLAESQRQLREQTVKYEELRHARSRLEAEVLKHRDKEKAVASQIEKLEAELLKQKENNQAANTKLEELRAIKAELETELSQLGAKERSAANQIKQLDLVRIELADKLASAESQLVVSRKESDYLRRVETSLRGDLDRLRKENNSLQDWIKRTSASAELSQQRSDILQQALERTADQIVRRDARAETLSHNLESLRHRWTALPVRQSLKRLATWPVNSSELVRINAMTPGAWNLVVADFNFGLSIFPDVSRPDVFSIEGWMIQRENKSFKPAVRLITESGSKHTAKCGRTRIDIPLLYPKNDQAAHSGFAFLELAGVGDTISRLEIRRTGGQWMPVALIDFCGIGWQYFMDVSEILESRLFDASWYANTYNFSDLDRLVLISHYLREGAVQGLFPNPLFDTAFYFETNPEICATGENPLLSYFRANKDGKPRLPNQWFDPAWYLATYKDVARAALDPFVHYLDHGRWENRNPGPRFDVAIYLDNYPDVKEDGKIDALSHFLHYGKAEGREAPDPQAVRWIHRTHVPSDGKANLLLVGHVLGNKLFGGERSLLELIQLINRDEFNIFCTFPRIHRPFIERIKPFVSGIAVFPYEWWDGSSPDTDGFEGQFEEILRSHAIDLVHVNSIMLRDPLIAAKRLGIPSVLHLREIVRFDRALAEHIGLAPQQIVEEIAERTDLVIANSHFTQSQYQNARHSFVLYNTADEVDFDMPLRRRDGALRVAMLSSNLPKKGVEDFFAMAALASMRNYPLEFWLIGPETDWVKRYLAERGPCPGNVHLAGYIDHPRDALRQVDVVVNLSNFAESFGRTVAEGMLARRPAVVYDFGALPELIRDGVDGFVVPFRDVNAGLERLNRLAQDPTLLEQMAESARARALSNFSRRVGAKTLSDIYATILQKPDKQKSSHVCTLPETSLSPRAGRKVRIGYFLWHFPVPSETFVLNELRHFVQAGHDVRVFCTQSPFKDFKPDFQIEWQQVKSPQELATRIQESEREVMHSHFVFPTVTQYLWPACESARVPFTFIAHGQDVFRHTSAAANQLDEITRSPYCRNVFAPGTFHRDLFLQSGVPEDKIILNPQTILFHAYEAHPIASRLEHPKRSICAIHRFVEKKGLSNAIEAAAQLAPLGISLYLYGYGPLEQSYREQVTRLGLDNVIFAGPITDRDHMIAVFREHDLFLCPSIRANDGDMDGIPTILLEAMASHVPVVASRVSSIPDLIRDGVTGYLCEPGDANSLAQAILRFYQDSTAKVRAIIENGREIVGKRFDIANASRILLRTWSGEGLDVILVTFNATEEVREVVARLYRYTKTPFRLYLVDNGSEPDTLDYLRGVEQEHDNVRLLAQSKNLFVGPGFNKGLEAGSSPFAVYLCSREGYVLSEGWDQAILNYMEDHPEVGLAGTLGYSPSYFTGADYVTRLEPFSRFRNQAFAKDNPDRVFRHVQGGMFVVRRSMFEAIGGFSETVPHNHTDVEYSYYAESCGWELGNLPDMVALYNKTRPELTSRLTEAVAAVHPGSKALAPLLDSVVSLQSNLCNVCGSAVSFAKKDGSDYVCPACASAPFHRSLYRFLAESTLTYRRLISLCAGEFDCLLPKWKAMFAGRTLDYFQLLAEKEQYGRIDHQSNQLDLVILRVPDSVPDLPDALVLECCRILKPRGTFLYFQTYGMDPVLSDAAESKSESPRDADAIASKLQGLGAWVTSRVRYASAAVRYSEHVIFACEKSPGR